MSTKNWLLWNFFWIFFSIVLGYSIHHYYEMFWPSYNIQDQVTLKMENDHIRYDNWKFQLSGLACDIYHNTIETASPSFVTVIVQFVFEGKEYETLLTLP